MSDDTTEWTKSTCARCAVGCGFRTRGQAGDLDVRGDPEHPTNDGCACRRGIEETSGPAKERIEVPHVREDGELVEATWTEALDRATELLGEPAARDPDSVAVLGSGQQTMEAGYLLGRVARGTIGTRHYDANTTLCMASAVAAYYGAFGSDAPPPTYDDVPEADRHVVWGANPAVAHPVMFRWINWSTEAEDTELIVVDPVETETAEAADHHVRPEPGRDHELARAVLARVVERGGVDEAFVDAHTTGFEQTVADLPSPAEGAELAGVEESTVDLLAEALDHQTLLYWAMGVNQSVRGTATAGALIDLCLATGNLGPASGPFSITGQSNSMGTRVVSSKGTWPGNRTFEDPDQRETVAETWDLDPAGLPEDSGPGPVGIANAIGNGDVEACWAVATNPAAGMPDVAAVQDALADVPLVVQDAFRTATVELADVVLPAATWGEIEGTLCNMDRRVSRVRRAAEAPGKAQPDVSIIAELGRRLGTVDLPSDPETVFEEAASLTAGTDADISGLSYDRLDEDLAVRWPAPDEDAEGGYRYHEDGEWDFPTPSGRARFSDTPVADLPEGTDGDYPLVLNTGRSSDAYNTGIRTRTGDSGPVPARIHPDTLDEYSARVSEGVEDVRCRIDSTRASVQTVLTEDDGIPRDSLWIPVHHPDANELTVPATDPISDEPNFKQSAVRLRSP